MTRPSRVLSSPARCLPTGDWLTAGRRSDGDARTRIGKRQLSGPVCSVRRAGLAAAAARVLIGLALLAPGPAQAYEQRRNTPSFGVQYGYGAMNGSGVFEWEDDNPLVENPEYRHEDFRWGGALGFHIRYSLDQTHAVGVTFEDRRFERKSGLENPEDPTLEVAKQLQVTAYQIDYYVYFDRRARTTAYLQLGAGFHRDTFRLKKNENLIGPFGPCATAGFGVEYFVRPAFTIDATLRGIWLGERSEDQLRFRGSAPVAASLQLGFQYYLLK